MQCVHSAPHYEGLIPCLTNAVCITLPTEFSTLEEFRKNLFQNPSSLMILSFHFEQFNIPQLRVRMVTLHWRDSESQNASPAFSNLQQPHSLSLN